MKVMSYFLEALRNKKRKIHADDGALHEAVVRAFFELALLQLRPMYAQHDVHFDMLSFSGALCKRAFGGRAEIDLFVSQPSARVKTAQPCECLVVSVRGFQPLSCLFGVTSPSFAGDTLGGAPSFACIARKTCEGSPLAAILSTATGCFCGSQHGCADPYEQTPHRRADGHRCSNTGTRMGWH